MSSNRLVSIEVVQPGSGVCRIVCDWEKGDWGRGAYGAHSHHYKTFLQYDFGKGAAHHEEVKTHATLYAALGRCARLAKRMKL
jgi:hypothetical protein